MNEASVLILGDPDEYEIQSVLSLLRELGERPLVVDAADFPNRTAIGIVLSKDPWLELEGVRYTLRRIKAAWHRRVLVRAYQGPGGRAERNYWTSEWRTAFNGLIACLPHCMWLNPPELQDLVGRNKLYQLHVAHDQGFVVPKTLVTSSTAEAIEFVESHPSVVLKRLGVTDLGMVSRTIRMDVEKMKSMTVDVPLFLQEEIEKHADVRVVYVNGDCFAVSSFPSLYGNAEVDSRFAGGVRTRATLVPQVVCDLRRVMESLGLLFGVIDLIHTKDHRFVFLEVNPQGRWCDVDMILDGVIARQIARFLSGRSGGV